jgi:predicted hydrolase (HD superfamily)
MIPGKMKSIDFPSLVNKKAAYINTRLYNIVQSVYRVNYVGHPSFVIGEKLQRHLLSKDGLHLTRDLRTDEEKYEKTERHDYELQARNGIISQIPMAEVECLSSPGNLVGWPRCSVV